MKRSEIPTDLNGMHVGELEVIEFSYRGAKSKQYWKCKCHACGAYKDVLRQNLLTGVVRTCGCQRGFYNYNRRKVNTYDLSGEYGIGFTSKGEQFLFDLEDFEKIKKYNWHISSDGYVKCSTPNISLHRLVMNVIDSSLEVDHVHHVKSDNRKTELRIVTTSQNQMNQTPRKHSSPCTGVSWHKKKNAWIAQISLNGKLKYLGIYKDLEDAIKARKEAEKQYFGDYMYNAI